MKTKSIFQCLCAMVFLLSTENILADTYVGGAVARAQGTVGATEMNQRMADLGYDANAQVFGKNRNAWDLFAGYEFSSYLSVEAGYTDLGVVRTRLSGSTVDIRNYLKDANQVHPRSASGYEVALLGTYPLTDQDYLFAKGGALFARSRYKADAQTDVAFRNDSGTDFLFGVGAGHRFNERWDLRLELQNVRVEGENIRLLGLGLIYRFHQPARKPKEISLPVAAPVVIAPTPVAPIPVVPEVVVKNDCGENVAKDEQSLSNCKPKEVQPTSIRLAIQFQTASFLVETKYLTEVEKVADFMKKYPNTKVTIEGHTDNRGNNDFNKKLSQNRAKAVHDLLINQFGISEERVAYVGYGQDHPIADNTAESGRAINRRVMAEVSNAP